jgi:hypothetical protein
MPTQATKHPNQFIIGMNNIMGGLCLIANPESIPEGTLAQFDNWEYGTLLNQPQVCPGVVSQYDMTNDAETLFYDEVHDIWYCSTGTSLYSTNLITKTLLGTLTGAYRPIYSLYDDVVLVASGGQIQKITSGTTLATVAGSPLSHWVAHNNGRVEAFNINSDVKNYSAIGDYNGWMNNPADISSAQFVNIGYKDAGKIACTIKLSTDSIVIKTNGSVYRIQNENDFTNIAVVPAAQKAGAFNHYSGLALLNKAYFVGPEGFNSFGTVQAYGSVSVDEPSPGYMINGWYVVNVPENARVWHVPCRKQVWCKTSNQNEILIYHYGLNAWSRRQFRHTINDVVVKGNDVYIAYGTKVAKLDDGVSTDDGEIYISTLVTKRYIPTSKKYIMKRVKFVTYNFISGDYVLTVGGKIFPTVFNSTSDIADTDNDIADTDMDIVSPYEDFAVKRKRTRKRARAIQVVVTVNSGRIAIRDIGILVAEIGQ